MLQAGSISSATVLQSQNRLTHYLQASALLHLIPPRRIINPFASTALGLNLHSPYLTPYILPGAGIQVRLFKNILLHMQASYQISSHVSSNRSVQFNAGILGTAFRKKTTRLLHETISNAVVIPKKDTDGDGVTDDEDSCVTVPGSTAFHGCPDMDGDGIPDYADACPLVHGYAKYKGCPAPDTDGDGILDDADSCRTIPGFKRYHGCPVPDSDGDGVDDEQDQCPLIPGLAKYQGCPPPSAEIEEQIRAIASHINFEVNKATLTRSSLASLDQLVNILLFYPHYKLIIEGHTDNSGSKTFNLGLSLERARAVESYLISHGVAKGRLFISGYGDTKPVATNNTKEGKAANRRTELKVIQ